MAIGLILAAVLMKFTNLGEDVCFINAAASQEKVLEIFTVEFTLRKFHRFSSTKTTNQNRKNKIICL